MIGWFYLIIGVLSMVLATIAPSKMPFKKAVFVLGLVLMGVGIWVGM